MLEVREVVKQWLAGEPKKRIAARLGLDPKTARRYITAAVEAGVMASEGAGSLTEERMAAIWASLRTPPERVKGDAGGSARSTGNSSRTGSRMACG